MRKISVFGVLIVFLIAVLPALPTEAAHDGISTVAMASGHAACAGVSQAVPTTPECEAFIASYPAPPVSQLPVDYGVVADETFIRFNKNNVNIYNAPNGSVVETLVTGYTYVTPIAFENGWAQLARNRWVSMEDARIARPSALTGVEIGALQMPFAFILWNHNAATAPAGVRSASMPLRRYQMVNIYATVNVRGWDWHLIGPGMWTNQQNLSIVYPAAPAAFEGRWVAVNLFEQNLVAYEGGVPRFAALVSSGLKDGKWDTHEGTFTVHSRVISGTMNGAEGREDYYSLDKVPYAQYFDNLISLHGTYWHDSFGYPHSHGCVNLSITDAKWLYDNWLTDGSVVYVYAGE